MSSNSNSNRNRIHPYVIVGSLTALGGVALGVASSWIFNKFTKKRHEITYPTTHHVQILSNYDENVPVTRTRTDGVYIQEDEHTQFLTNEEFQRYFEYNINKDDGVELDWCLLEYALKLDPMNLRFFKNEQKTIAFQTLAAEQNIEAIVHCRYDEDIYDLQPQASGTITYKKYEIHDYMYELYGNEIYRFIDHPEGYSYDELMSMPPPEYKDMTVSEVFNTIQHVEEIPSKQDIINSIIEENTPDILKIEFTDDLTSDEEDEHIIENFTNE
jgi:hypothetical protein